MSSMESNIVDGDVDFATKESAQRKKATDITMLNDDCLLEIFSYLSEADLCAVKGSHQRFIESADATFKKRHMSDNGTYIFPKRGQSHHVIKRVIERFGNLLSDVKIDFSGYPLGNDLNIYFSLLNDCTALQRLSIAGCNLHRNHSIISGKPFQNVESLSFDGWGSGTVTAILNAINPFKLKILKFPRKTVSCLEIGMFRLWTTEDLLPFIANRMVNIEELEIGLYTISLNTLILPNMKNLRRLVMECNSGEDIVRIINELAKIESLRELDLTYATGKLVYGDLSGAISNLKNVQRFTYSSFTIDLCVDLIIGYSDSSMDYYCDAGFNETVYKYTFTRSRHRHEQK